MIVVGTNILLSTSKSEELRNLGGILNPFNLPYQMESDGHHFIEILFVIDVRVLSATFKFNVMIHSHSAMNLGHHFMLTVTDKSNSFHPLLGKFSSNAR